MMDCEVARGTTPPSAPPHQDIAFLYQVEQDLFLVTPSAVIFTDTLQTFFDVCISKKIWPRLTPKVSTIYLQTELSDSVWNYDIL